MDGRRRLSVWEGRKLLSNCSFQVVSERLMTKMMARMWPDLERRRTIITNFSSCVEHFQKSYYSLARIRKAEGSEDLISHTPVQATTREGDRVGYGGDVVPRGD